MRPTVFGLLYFLLFALGCDQPNAKNNEIRATHEKLVRKDYKPFLEKFLTDSATQLSSIKFPLKTVIQEDNGDVIKLIERKDWKYANLRIKKDYIISSQWVDEKEFEVVIQIAETGVYVTYSFEYENGKWILTLIEDAST